MSNQSKTFDGKQQCNLCFDGKHKKCFNKKCECPCKRRPKPTSEECNHEIGWKAMGGFPGHEHTHTIGEQVCLNCGKTLKDIYLQKQKEAIEAVLVITRLDLFEKYLEYDDVDRAMCDIKIKIQEKLGIEIK